VLSTLRPDPGFGVGADPFGLLLGLGAQRSDLAVSRSAEGFDQFFAAHLTSP
jgi:hypothetical protein